MASSERARTEFKTQLCPPEFAGCIFSEDRGGATRRRCGGSRSGGHRRGGSAGVAAGRRGAAAGLSCATSGGRGEAYEPRSSPRAAADAINIRGISGSELRIEVEAAAHGD